MERVNSPSTSLKRAVKAVRMRDLSYEERIKLYERAMALRKEKGWGARKIARELSVHEMTVHRWLHENIKPDRRWWQEEEDEALRSMVRAGMTTKEISEKLGRSKASVAYRKVALGLALRRQLLNVENLRPSKDLAYVLGVLMGDGSAYRMHGRKGRVMLRTKDRPFNEHFDKALRNIGLHPFTRPCFLDKRRRSKGWRTIACSTSFVKWYEKLSLTMCEG